MSVSLTLAEKAHISVFNIMYIFLIDNKYYLPI